MIRHRMDPGKIIEQKEGNDAYYENIICKSYHSRSRKNIYHRLNVFIDDTII